MNNAPGLLDRVWQNLVCALIGEQLDDGDDICGAVISIRPKLERIQIWLRDKNNYDVVEGIGQRILKVLDLNDMGLVAAFDFAVGLEAGSRSNSFCCPRECTDASHCHLTMQSNIGSLNHNRRHFQINNTGQSGRPRLTASRQNSYLMPSTSPRLQNAVLRSAPGSRSTSPTKSSFLNPFAKALGMPLQSSSSRESNSTLVTAQH